MRNFPNPKVAVGMLLVGAALGLSWRAYESRIASGEITTTGFNEMTQLAGDFGVVQPESEKKKEDFRALVNSIVPTVRFGIIPMKVFEENYDTYGPETMIDVLNEDPSCHTQAHFLGRVIYEHTQDLTQSLAICQSKCSAGCIHGVLMQMFNAPMSDTDPNPNAMTSEVRQKIADTCKNPEVVKYTGIGNCYHAVGHVIDALTEDDIPAALDLCRDVFKSEGVGAIYYCASGVYMQQDITSGAAYASGKDRLSPCDTSAYPAACYRYKLDDLFRFPSGYALAQTLCLSLTGSQQRGCFHGLGFNGYQMVDKDPSSLNQLCAVGDDLDKQMCVEGALGAIWTMSGGHPSDACKTYTAGSASMCKSVVNHGNFTMKRDFALYTQ